MRRRIAKNARTCFFTFDGRYREKPRAGKRSAGPPVRPPTTPAPAPERGAAKPNRPALCIRDSFNDDGTLNEHGGRYAGMDRFAVREQIERDLASAGLLEKVEAYTNNVGYSERTSVAIEPKLSMQWFLKMDELSKPALQAVMDDTVRLVPSKFKNVYRHWMENVRDVYKRQS